jgi:WD40 repeat protein
MEEKENIQIFNKKRKNNKYNSNKPMQSDYLKNNINIHFEKNIINDTYNYYFNENYHYNSFIAFNSISSNILYLVYSKGNSIDFFNMKDNKLMLEIKNAHKEYISIFRYYYDKINRRDLVLSLSRDGVIKLWNINNFECINTVETKYKKGFLGYEFICYSLCLLIENNNIYMVTAIKKKYFDNIIIPFRVIDLNGKIIKEIKNSEIKDIYYIDSFYDDKLSKNFIIISSLGMIISYDYNKNEIYHKYIDDNNNKIYKKFIIRNNEENMTELISSSYDGNIRIWNFHSSDLISLIKVHKAKLFDICMWNDNFLCVGCETGRIKIIDLVNKKCCKELKKDLIGLNSSVTTIQKVIFSNNSEFLVSKCGNQITLWEDKK